MKSRWATLLEIPEALSYIIANRLKNAVDMKVFTYPTTKVMRCEGTDGSAGAYLPVHTVGVLESMGWAQNLEAKDKLNCSISLLSEVEVEAAKAQIKELYFISSDERTDEAAKKLGFEKVTCYRKRL